MYVSVLLSYNGGYEEPRKLCLCCCCCYRGILLPITSEGGQVIRYPGVQTAAMRVREGRVGRLMKEGLSLVSSRVFARAIFLAPLLTI